MKEITVILCCTWKFALTFPVAIFGMKFSFWKTILVTNIGGLLGLLFFIYLSRILIFLWNKYIIPRFKHKKAHKRMFSRRNRFIVLVKKKYGLPGIVILSPLLLSIPIGAFLTTKYYGARIDKILWLLAGQIGWSFIYTCFYMFIQTS